MFFLNGARILVNSIKKSHGKMLGALISDLIFKGEGKNNFYMQYYDAVLDMINSKFSKGSYQQSASKSKSKPKVFFQIFSKCKLLHDLVISRMFRENILLEAQPNNISVKFPVIVHKA